MADDKTDTWEKMTLLFLQYIEAEGVIKGSEILKRYGAAKLSQLPLSRWGNMSAEMRISVARKEQEKPT